MDLAAVVDELYGLLPAEFTAARNDRAKAVGAEDKTLAGLIRRLPKPSAAAWAVNMLVRRRPDDIAGIVELGAALREAQDALDRDEMKALGQQRQALIAAIGRAAGDLAAELGNPISGSAAGELEQTLQAAMADPAAALAVRSGRLVRALASTGLEPPDLAGAVAGPAPEPAAPGAAVARQGRQGRRQRRRGRRRRDRRRRPTRPRRRSERDLARARRDLDEAERRDERARAELEASTRASRGWRRSASNSRTNWTSSRPAWPRRPETRPPPIARRGRSGRTATGRFGPPPRRSAASPGRATQSSPMSSARLFWEGE